MFTTDFTKGFFTQDKCDRCGGNLKIRTTSWFTEETICMNCSDKEAVIKAGLPDYGRSYEGCGYVPKIKMENSNGRS